MDVRQLRYEFVPFSAVASEYHRLVSVFHSNRMMKAHLTGALIFEAILSAITDNINSEGVRSKEFDANAFHGFFQGWQKFCVKITQICAYVKFSRAN